MSSAPASHKESHNKTSSKTKVRKQSCETKVFFSSKNGSNKGQDQYRVQNKRFETKVSKQSFKIKRSRKSHQTKAFTKKTSTQGSQTRSKKSSTKKRYNFPSRFKKHKFGKRLRIKKKCEQTRRDQKVKQTGSTSFEWQQKGFNRQQTGSKTEGIPFSPLSSPQKQRFQKQNKGFMNKQGFPKPKRCSKGHTESSKGHAKGSKKQDKCVTNHRVQKRFQTKSHKQVSRKGSPTTDPSKDHRKKVKTTNVPIKVQSRTVQKTCFKTSVFLSICPFLPKVFLNFSKTTTTEEILNEGEAKKLLSLSTVTWTRNTELVSLGAAVSRFSSE